MSASPYPAYKDSGLEWLGKVPVHWEVTRLKYIGEAVIGLTYDPSQVVDEGQGILVLRSSNVQRGRIVLNDNVYVAATIPHNLIVQPGDILICSRNGSRALIGKNATIDEASSGHTFGAFMTVFRSQHSAYVRWLLNSPLFEFQSGAFLTATINQLTVGIFNNFEVPFPPPAEQDEIAAFLDCETGKTDALIGEQEQLIALLKEKRQSVISQAVTKGLDLGVPMKPSGIEWLGEVPSDWTIGHIKRYCVNVTDGAHISPETEGGVFDFVSTRDLKDDFIDFEGSLKTSEGSYKYMVQTGCRPEQGDVLFSKDGTIGRTALVVEEREFAVASSLIILRPDPNIVLPQFLFWLMQSRLVVSQVERYVKGAGLPRLSIQNLLKVFGTLPPKWEQAQIASELAAQTRHIRDLITTSQRAITLLQERRSALISAAVTGKIDVRNLAQPQAEQAEAA